MPTVLITGANRGIGLEFVRQYAKDGWKVVATCRNPIGVGALGKIEGDVAVYGLEVNDDRSLDRFTA
ncbi:MAG: SDR family NAD(P)-dependent oxidoreductase, partial [Proteobacteria bacterium]|nr:SDR family NAD(P)-dependent oxidoreductase [Pseudomonadota bacterium]